MMARQYRRREMPSREELRRLVDAQLSNMDIARRYDVSAATIARWVEKLDLLYRRGRKPPRTSQRRKVRRSRQRALEEPQPLCVESVPGTWPPEVRAFLEQPLDVMCWWMRRYGRKLPAGWRRDGRR